MRITSEQLRQIIREELGRMNEGRRGEDEGRHGMSYGYGSFGGGYPRGGDDEGPRYGRAPRSAESLGWKVGDRVKGAAVQGTVTSVSSWDMGVKVDWDDGNSGEYDGKYLARA